MRWFVIGIFTAGTAVAQPNGMPITERNFDLDIEPNLPEGSSRTMGMGGAGVAFAEGTAGMLINAAATAVRSATDNDWFTWDFHLQSELDQAGQDADNNGERNGGGYHAGFGVSVGLGTWGVGVVAATSGHVVVDEATQDQVDLGAQRVHLSVAKRFPRVGLALGAGIVGSVLSYDVNGQTRFTAPGQSYELGAAWLPTGQRFRVGANLSSRATPDLGTLDCDPLHCAGTILPRQHELPWHVAVGGAYRFGPRPWNASVDAPFLDERSVTVALDAVVTGSGDGYGMDAYARGYLQPSGRHVTVALRGGVESEVLPGWVRLRVGAYWEPSRFAGIDGRVHATFGMEGRVLAFRLWGPRRLLLSLRGDMTRSYRDIGASIGLWH